jgi:hypothetical protein
VLGDCEASQKSSFNAGLEQFENARRVIDEPFLVGLDFVREGSDLLLLYKWLVVAASVR